MQTEIDETGETITLEQASARLVALEANYKDDRTQLTAIYRNKKKHLNALIKVLEDESTK